MMIKLLFAALVAMLMCARPQCGNIHATGPWCGECGKHISWGAVNDHSPGGTHTAQ